MAKPRAKCCVRQYEACLESMQAGHVQGGAGRIEDRHSPFRTDVARVDLRRAETETRAG